jgi:hypothetical protein
VFCRYLILYEIVHFLVLNPRAFRTVRAVVVPALVPSGEVLPCVLTYESGSTFPGLRELVGFSDVDRLVYPVHDPIAFRATSTGRGLGSVVEGVHGVLEATTSHNLALLVLYDRVAEDLERGLVEAGVEHEFIELLEQSVAEHLIPAVLQPDPPASYAGDVGRVVPAGHIYELLFDHQIVTDFGFYDILMTEAPVILVSVILVELPELINDLRDVFTCRK